MRQHDRPISLSRCSRFHFESMAEWPYEDERILELKYEEIIGNEAATFGRIAEFYGWSPDMKQRAEEIGEAKSAKNLQGKYAHIRDPKTGQWHEHFQIKLKINSTKNTKILLSVPRTKIMRSAKRRYVTITKAICAIKKKRKMQKNVDTLRLRVSAIFLR